MIRFVVDASSIGPILLQDEAKSLVAQLDEALVLGECIVPAHWHFEVANMILAAIRRGHIALSHARAGLAQIASLDVPSDHDSIEAAPGRTFDLATQHTLSIYDAAYLELAMRMNLSLISNDRALVVAAQAEGLQVITGIAS